MSCYTFVTPYLLIWFINLLYLIPVLEIYTCFWKVRSGKRCRHHHAIDDAKVRRFCQPESINFCLLLHFLTSTPPNLSASPIRKEVSHECAWIIFMNIRDKKLGSFVFLDVEKERNTWECAEIKQKMLFLLFRLSSKNPGFRVFRCRKSKKSGRKIWLFGMFVVPLHAVLTE